MYIPEAYLVIIFFLISLYTAAEEDDEKGGHLSKFSWILTVCVVGGVWLVEQWLR